MCILFRHLSNTCGQSSASIKSNVYVYEKLSTKLVLCYVMFVNIRVHRFWWVSMVFGNMLLLSKVYKFSNSQSKLVILHRMYFHWRSLKQSENPKYHKSKHWSILWIRQEKWEKCDIRSKWFSTYLSTPLNVVWAPRIK